jgi:hypothetical protein
MPPAGPSPRAAARPAAAVVKELAALFRRNGYVRPPAVKRLANLGYGVFRRGYEFRLTAADENELQHIRDLLVRAGFKPGCAFVKGRQFRQPVYGRKMLERFLQLIDEPNA